MRLRLARALFALAATAGALSVWALITGGFRVHVLGVPLSVRGADRAAVIAAACAIVAASLHDGLQRRLWTVVEAAGRVPLLPVLAALAAAFLLSAGVMFGARAAGGADQYGYITQAELWRRGDLHIDQAFVASIPWPNREWSFAPLGYRPAENYTIVPTYPPGLPLLMVAFSSVLGETGVYAVTWVAGAALVLLTYALGVRLSGPVVGAIAALSLACNPTVVMFTLWVMSDVPVAAFWTASVLLACRNTAAGAIVSGLLAGLAVLIRPNLVPLAIVPLVVAAFGFSGSLDRRWRRAAMFGAGFAPVALFLAWLFDHLYGSPFTSGYGDHSALFAWKHVPINFKLYPQWILESQGPLVFVFLAAPALLLRRDGRAVIRAAFLTFIGLLFALYLLYLPFDGWWWTRFLLPAYPFVFILAAEVVWLGAERFGRRIQAAAALLFALGMVYYGGGNTYRWDVYQVGYGEEKYVEVGRHIDRTLPENAIVIAMQHSGAIRYYSGRLTVRYDYIDADWLDRSIEHLLRSGYEPFIVLDNWELPRFREKFASQKHVALVATEPEDAPCTHTTYIYRVVPAPHLPASERVPKVLGCR